MRQISCFFRPCGRKSSVGGNVSRFLSGLSRWFGGLFTYVTDQYATFGTVGNPKTWSGADPDSKNTDLPLVGVVFWSEKWLAQALQSTQAPKKRFIPGPGYYLPGDHSLGP